MVCIQMKIQIQKVNKNTNTNKTMSLGITFRFVPRDRASNGLHKAISKAATDAALHNSEDDEVGTKYWSKCGLLTFLLFLLFFLGTFLAS